MSDSVIQLIVVPHRPVHTQDEINKDLAPAFEILQRHVCFPSEILTDKD